MVEILGRGAAVLAPMVVAGEDSPARQRRRSPEGHPYEVNQAYDCRDRDHPALGVELGAVAVDDLRLLLEHQNDRAARGHDTQRLETGVQ